MIQPIHGHILIEPLKHESFISSQKGTYEEIGIVVRLPLAHGSETSTYGGIKVGEKVYFDSWLIARYPDGKDGEIWLVKCEDIRAIERNED